VASLVPQSVINYGMTHGREGDLRTRQQRGETLSPADQAYLDHATQLESMGGHPLEAIEQGVGQGGATALVGEAAPKILRGAQSAAENGVRRLAGSGPGVAKQLVRAVTEDNRKISLHNSDRMADAQQKWQEASAKAAADYKAELLKLRQKHALKDTPEAQQAYQAARAKAEQANTDARAAYNKEIGKVALANRAATAAEQAKSAQSAKVQVGGSKLIYGLNQLDRALNAKAAEMFDEVRAKVGGITLPRAGLTAATQSALKSITGTSEVPKVFHDILTKAADDATIKPGDEWKYSPTGKPSTPVTFADLQGYYSETGAELSKGTLAGDVFTATKNLHNAIGDMMQQMAKAAGPEANKLFWDSRVFYRGYMDIFHEPAGASESGSPVAQALLAKDPEVAVTKFVGKSGNRGIADLRRYSPSLANLAQDVRQSAQESVKVPARSSVADIKPPKISPVPAGPNLPLPPILPEPETVPFRQPKLTPMRTISGEELQRANEASVLRHGTGLTSRLLATSLAWPLWNMLSDLSRGRAISPQGLIALPAAGATGMAIEEILAHPDVNRFLTRLTRQQLSQIPLELRRNMPQIVSIARSKGIPVSPILAAYAATIQHNQAGSQPDQSGSAVQPAFIPYPSQGAPQ
jgi:hypothetical protein